MSANNTSNDDGKGPKNKNPCGICRANGSPVCKGHGGGGGGGGGSSSDTEKDSKDSVQVGAPVLTPNTLEARLALSPVMRSLDEMESTFILQNPDAIYTLKLDIESGLMVFSGHKDLAEEEQTTLHQFFETIKNELNSFKQELINKGEKPELVHQIEFAHKGNNLTLRFPNPKYYDEFTQRLIDKNIIQLDPVLQQTKSRVAETANLAPPSVEMQSSKYKSPTPFDIKGGPKPDGWK